MATILLPHDFKEFLKLLNSHGVEYLLIGGYAVNYHGYPRATGDMDVWIAIDRTNADRVAAVLREFGFVQATPEPLTQPDTVIRMGVPPMRIEVLTSISGVDFASAFGNRIVAELDGIPVNVIDREDLKVNKRASGQLKDLADLQALE
jgi:predicted nucleotidyltransferase